MQWVRNGSRLGYRGWVTVYFRSVFILAYTGGGREGEKEGVGRMIVHHFYHFLPTLSI